MLEALVLNYGDLPRPAFFLIGATLAALGGLIAALALPAPSLPLSRSWFYLRLGLATLVLTLGQGLWILYLPALKAGISFALVLADVFSCLLFGAYVGQIARARSLDAYGNGKGAWMAFVPIANLFLLFRPGQPPSPAPGSVGIALLGVALSVFVRLAGTGIEGATATAADQIQNDPQAVAIVQALSVRARGIEVALDDLILAEGAPVAIDATLTLQSVTRSDLIITYDYVLDEPAATSLDTQYRNYVRDTMCGGLLPYFQAGAAARIRFARKDGAEIEVLDLSVTGCTT